MIYRKIIEAKALPNFLINIKFEDGKQGKVDFSSEVELGVFQKLSINDNFSKIKIELNGSALVWDIEVPEIEKPDASAEWLYDQVS